MTTTLSTATAGSPRTYSSLRPAWIPLTVAGARTLTDSRTTEEPT
jgi:hypothetical protein